MFAPVLLTPPAAPPVSLAEAKTHLRVETGEEDGLITLLIGAATAHLDGYSGVLGRALVTQTWRQRFAAFADPLRLALPAQSVTAVTNGGSTVSAALYDLIEDAEGSAVALKPDQVWPTAAVATAPVEATFVAGYGDGAAVPAPIKAALLLMVGDLYRFRETVVVGANVSDVPMSATVRHLLAPYRRVGL